MAPFQADRLYTSEEFQEWAVRGRPSSSKSPFGTMWGIVNGNAQWIGVPPALTSLKNGCLNFNNNKNGVFFYFLMGIHHQCITKMINTIVVFEIITILFLVRTPILSL